MGAEKGSTPPTPPQSIEECRKRASEALGASQAPDTALAELKSNEFEAWIAHAEDPDVPLATWLREGAPAGVELRPEATGVFPPSIEAPAE